MSLSPSCFLKVHQQICPPTKAKFLVRIIVRTTFPHHPTFPYNPQFQPMRTQCPGSDPPGPLYIYTNSFKMNSAVHNSSYKSQDSSFNIFRYLFPFLRLFVIPQNLLLPISHLLIDLFLLAGKKQIIYLLTLLLKSHENAFPPTLYPPHRKRYSANPKLRIPRSPLRFIYRLHAYYLHRELGIEYLLGDEHK